MLNYQRTSVSQASISYQPQSWSADLGIPDVISFVRRRWGTMALGLFSFLVLGGLYMLFATPVYNATTLLVIDARKLEIFREGDVSAESPITNAKVETEIEVLRSRRMSEAVVDALQLTLDPEFMAGDNGTLSDFIRPISKIASLLVNTPTNAPTAVGVDPLKKRAVAILTSNMEVERVGLSYAIRISYGSKYPQEAARIANGIARVYLKEQQNRQQDEARQLSEWLSARIEELRMQGLSPDIEPKEKSAVRMQLEGFIQRYTQTIQQESLPAAQTRIITEAIAPNRPTSPIALRVLAASIFLGGVVGLGAAILKDLLDSRIRSCQQLRSAAQAACLGILPMFRVSTGRKPKHAEALPATLEARSRKFAEHPEFSVSLTAPLSLFAETLRSIKVAADNLAAAPAGVVGIVSAAPMEGKTTVAANLARLVAGTSKDVLLLDADLRNPTLTRKLVPSGTGGLIQVISDDLSIDGVLWSDPSTSLQFLPVGTDKSVMNSVEILASNRMKYVMNDLRARFRFIVVDLPPLLSLVDVRAASSLFDGFVFVAEWGVTTREAVSQSMEEGGMDGRMIGTVLNKVQLRKLRRYDSMSYVPASDGYIESSRLVG